MKWDDPAIESVTVPLESVVIDDDVLIRPLDRATAEEYAEILDDLPPAEVLRLEDGALLLFNGRHRHAAHKVAGRTEITLLVWAGTRNEAIVRGAIANTPHGRPLTRAQKRAAVDRLLADPEVASMADREIARRTGTSHGFVADRRESGVGNVTTSVEQLAAATSRYHIPSRTAPTRRSRMKRRLKDPRRSKAHQAAQDVPTNEESAEATTPKSVPTQPHAEVPKEGDEAASIPLPPPADSPTSGPAQPQADVLDRRATHQYLDLDADADQLAGTVMLVPRLALAARTAASREGIDTGRWLAQRIVALLTEIGRNADVCHGP